jgi:hypothetical protein
MLWILASEVVQDALQTCFQWIKKRRTDELGTWQEVFLGCPVASDPASLSLSKQSQVSIVETEDADGCRAGWQSFSAASCAGRQTSRPSLSDFRLI